VQPAWSRDWLIGLVIYRHGLRVSEACDLRWDDIDLPKRTIIVRRLKGSTDSVHYLERDEVKVSNSFNGSNKASPSAGWALDAWLNGLAYL
jgi:integrase